MTWLHPVDQTLLFTKNDKEDPRLGECVQIHSGDSLTSESLGKSNFVILGYPDDHGIALNGGRIGAKSAPKQIRTYLYKMTPHPQAAVLPQILDLGDLDVHRSELPERHSKGREFIRAIAQSNRHWISFGGGHDYGYCDSAGFAEVYGDQAVILNFDAHMDVRPVDQGFNSGTPFYRLLSEFSQVINFAEIGIQNQCNSRFHIAWAKKHGATIITLDDVHKNGLLHSLKHYLHDKKGKKIFLSVDIDAFTSNEAPGCSQSWTTGLYTKDFLEALHWMVQTFDVRGMGIYEVTPPLDEDGRTSKLAALLAYNFIFASQKG